MDLTHISDEDNLEIFLVIAALTVSLPKDYNNNLLLKRASKIEEACVYALAQGSDNIEIIKKFKGYLSKQAGMAELADAQDLKSCVRKDV